MVMRMQTRFFKFCIPDLGDLGGERPDLLIFEPAAEVDGKTGLDPRQWSQKAIAVEVETDPTKNGKQVAKNFGKNSSLGYDVWFVVLSERHKQFVSDLLVKDGIGARDYRISVMDPDSLGHLSNIQNGPSEGLSGEALAIYSSLGEGDGALPPAQRAGTSAHAVMELLLALDRRSAELRGSGSI